MIAPALQRALGTLIATATLALANHAAGQVSPPLDPPVVAPPTVAPAASTPPAVAPPAVAPAAVAPAAVAPAANTPVAVPPPPNGTRPASNVAPIAQSRNLPAYVSGVTFSVLGAISAAAGVVLIVTHETELEACQPTCPTEALQREQDGERDAHKAGIGLLVGGLGLLGGGIALASWGGSDVLGPPPSEQPPQLELAIGPGRLVLAGSF